MSSSSPSDQQQPAAAAAASQAAPPPDSSSEQAPLDQAKDKAGEVSGGAHHQHVDSSESTGPTLPLKSHFKGMPNQWEKNRSKAMNPLSN
ncbi:hypothetical protein PG985_011564 [Apiospora marii]|uniref:Uncharacterized protein n=1 Tax=Apiospora marii TaxID=335849 RepID=A0ABR1R0P6_9PEZI